MNDDRKPTLAEVTETVLERAKGDHAAAVRMLLASVMMDVGLLLQLLGMDRENVRARADEYLRKKVSDVQLRAQRAAHTPSGSGASQGTSPSGSAPTRILPSPPRRAINPARKKEARTRDAKAQLVRDLVQQAPAVTDPAAATRLARRMIDATLVLAQREFDERITANVDVKWGDLTLEHLDRLEINVPYLAEIRDCMRELRDAGRLPDRKTELRSVLSPEEMRAMKARCYAKRDAARHAIETMRMLNG